MNDVLFHATNTFRETKAYVSSAALQYLPALVKTIRSAPEAQSDPLDKVIALWSEKKYFTPEEFGQITEEPLREEKSVEQEDKVTRKPLVKPAMLGNMGDPHWLLPVSCMLEVVVLSPPLSKFDVRNTRIITNRYSPRVSKRSNYPKHWIPISLPE